MLTSLLRGKGGDAPIRTSRDLEKFIYNAASETAAQIAVNPNTALQNDAVSACARVLSESVAQVSLKTFVRTSKGKEPATDHWSYPILHDAPNHFQSSFEYREQGMMNMLLTGNSYGYINRRANGEIGEILPLVNHHIRVTQDDWNIRYDVSDGKGWNEKLPPEKVFHTRWWSRNGFTGEAPIQIMREAIGFAIALNRHGVKLFTNGAHPGLILKYKAWLSKEQEKQAQDAVEKGYGGDNAYKAMILGGDTGIERLGMTSVEAQYLELLRYLRSVLAGMLRVPSHMIDDLDRATFNNIEHLSLEFVKFTLMPWLRRWETAINLQLFTPKERGKYFAEFVVDSLERGDIKSRNEAYQLQRQNGILSRDEWREMENKNPLPLGAPDDLLEPGNMTAIGASGAVLRPGNNNMQLVMAGGKGA